MKYAIAILNIKPSEFWDLTLAEFNVAMDAFLWKEERDLRKLAQQAQWILMPYGKEPIPVSALMGDENPEEEKQVTTKEDLDDMMQSMGKGGN